MIETATKFVRNYFAGNDSHFIFERTASPKPSAVSAINLYIHIPFCNSLCPYCPYNKVAYEKAMAGPYLKAMLNEIELYRGLFGCLDISSVYIGGGTPTLLMDEVSEVLDVVRSRFTVSGDICIETSPAGLDDTTIAKLKACGIGLLSVGVQSFQDRFLEFMGRKYRAAVLDDALARAMQAGFKSINVDLMFALPGQKQADITYDLEKAIAAGVNQITMYPLFTFPYSSVGRYLQLKKVRMPDLGTRRTLYYHLYRYLVRNRFQRVSVWGFKKGDAPRYSSVTRDNYLGLGAGAGSHMPEGFYLNTFSVEQYISKCRARTFPTALFMDFNKAMQDYFWLYWRFYDTAIPKQGLVERFGSRDVKIQRLFGTLKLLGLVSETDECYVLNRRGSFWLHLVQNYFSLRYVNRVWSVAMSEPYPKAISL